MSVTLDEMIDVLDVTFEGAEATLGGALMFDFDNDEFDLQIDRVEDWVDAVFEVVRCAKAMMRQLFAEGGDVEDEAWRISGEATRRAAHIVWSATDHLRDPDAVLWT
jgi:hypothetical protein